MKTTLHALSPRALSLHPIHTASPVTVRVSPCQSMSVPSVPPSVSVASPSPAGEGRGEGVCSPPLLNPATFFTRADRGPLRFLAAFLRRRDAAIAAIIALVAETYGVPKPALISPIRTEAVAWPRHVAMSLIYSLGVSSITDIGAAFHRDHASVLHAIHIVRDRVEAYPELLAELSALAHRMRRLPQVLLLMGDAPSVPSVSPLSP